MGSNDKIITPADRFKNVAQVHQGWAKDAYKSFCLHYPEVEAKLYHATGYSVIWINGCEPDRFKELQTIFRNEFRPVTCHIEIVDTEPSSHLKTAEPISGEAQYWLKGAPITIREFNALVALSVPGQPEGSWDFDVDKDVWTFRSIRPLTDDEKAKLTAARDKVGERGDILFKVVEPTGEPASFDIEEVSITPAAHLGERNVRLKRLVERDEDEWRSFISDRVHQPASPLAPPLLQATEFSCMFDSADRSDLSLSELLTIYDRVDVLPDQLNPQWLDRLKINETDIQALASMRRLRLVVPHSIVRYPETRLFEAISEAAPDSLVLTRSLAARTLEHGQRKNPLLYAPLTFEQRMELLSSLAKVTTDANWLRMLKAWGEILDEQHELFAFRGAIGSYGYGVGKFLGAAILNLQGEGPRFAFQECGAGVEWAQALGSSFIPRTFGKFTEDAVSRVIASFLNRTPYRKTDPTTDRMHTVVDGLLSVADVPPLTVAKAFKSGQIARFRHVYGKLMASTATLEDLREAVKGLNAEVTSFESKAQRIKKLKIDAIPGAIISAVVGDQIDENVGKFASVPALWLFDVLENHLPDPAKRRLADIRDMLIGFATMTSCDAVIVSRSRSSVDATRQTEPMGS